MTDTEFAFNAPEDWPLTQFSVDVLTYRDGDEYVALGLNVDLEGRGRTRKAATLDLVTHIQMQLSFAIQKKQPELIFRPSEGHWWKLYQEIKERKLREAVNPQTADAGERDDDYQVGSLPIPAGMLDAARKRKPFRRAYVP